MGVGSPPALRAAPRLSGGLGWLARHIGLNVFPASLPFGSGRFGFGGDMAARLALLMGKKLLDCYWDSCDKCGGIGKKT